MRAELPPRPPGGTRLAIIGDVHGGLDEHDAAAFTVLQADLVCMVGDFGEEDLGLVSRICKMQVPKAVILGNHDGWHHAKANLGKAHQREGMKAPSQEDIRSFYSGVTDQLDRLGPDHVGYGAKHFAAQNLSVVGARPFSWGGREWRLGAGLCADLYGVGSMAESAARITYHICSQPAGSTVVVMGHNGPCGLGSDRSDICGVDWRPNPGDHGDPDLRAALDEAGRRGVHVPLVLFGHMHHLLKPLRGSMPQHRDMVHIDPATGTVCLNAAVVPRCTQSGRACLRHFAVADIARGIVSFAAHVWVDIAPQQDEAPGQTGRIAEVKRLLQLVACEDDAKCVRRVHLEHTATDTVVASPIPPGQPVKPMPLE